jgi:two-component system, OmpR family, alkaline phosphatase synthesis response regulator PhoP
MKERILVVEDEEDIRGLIEYSLGREGYAVHGVATGELGLKEARLKKPDLVLLDLMLPGMDGFEVCRMLKADPVTASTPVVIVTAKGEESDIVSGLEIGADDYVTKPFSPKVLVSRIRTVLRRRKKESDDPASILQVRDLVLHLGRHEVTLKGKAIVLTLTEFRILVFLARNPGWVYTRDQIVEAVQGSDYPVTQRSVDVQMVGLRKKLGGFGKLIETVRGVGYRLKE